MLNSFETLLTQIYEENLGGNTGVSNPNSTFTGTKPQQASTKTAQTTTNPTPTQPTQPSSDLAQEFRTFLEKNKTNPEFINIIKKTIEEMEKENQQKTFVAQQNNTQNAPSQGMVK